MTATKRNYLFSPAVRTGITLYGLFGGVLWYAAPNKFLGPNSSAHLCIWKKTCLQSNDLDPVTIHHGRLSGACLTSSCVAHLLLWDNGNPAGCGRALSRMTLFWSLAMLPTFAMAALDTSGSFCTTTNAIFTAISALLALYSIRLFKTIPAPAPVSRTRTQQVALMVAAFYAGIFSVTMYIGGPIRYFVPKTPLENDEYDVTMMDAGRGLGAGLMPFAVTAFMDGRFVPEFILKIACLVGVLVFPVHFQAALDTTGYFNQEAYSVLTVFHVLWMIFMFQAAGAFKSTEKAAKTA